MTTLATYIREIKEIDMTLESMRTLRNQSTSGKVQKNFTNFKFELFVNINLLDSLVECVENS